jgi:hypothetical protein
MMLMVLLSMHLINQILGISLNIMQLYMSHTNQAAFYSDYIVTSAYAGNTACKKQSGINCGKTLHMMDPTFI